MDKILVSYVWLDSDQQPRSKTRVLERDIVIVDGNIVLDNVPDWNYDGSSTEQAPGVDSEVTIKPVRACICPFRRKTENIIVLCECYGHDGKPIKTNTRHHANELFQSDMIYNPWYGIEQEFFLKDMHTGNVLGFEYGSYSIPAEQGKYYCSIGAGKAFGRPVIEDALENMLYAGLTVSGINAEVAPGQWEYQIGPVEGIDSADQVILSRYILERTAEQYNVIVDYHPKALGDDWNGSGCHTNFSTNIMRSDGGIEHINNAMIKLKKRHSEHMEKYGNYNELRMTGKHETADYNTFTYGVANRGASVRIGNAVNVAGKGYFEDRRPSSNMDPYVVTGMIFETCCLLEEDVTIDTNDNVNNTMDIE